LRKNGHTRLSYGGRVAGALVVVVVIDGVSVVVVVSGRPEPSSMKSFKKPNN